VYRQKVLKYRFDEGTIQELLEFKWWEKDIEWIQEHTEEFDDVEKFISNAYEED
jgi:hypothetical protein